MNWFQNTSNIATDFIQSLELLIIYLTENLKIKF